MKNIIITGAAATGKSIFVTSRIGLRYRGELILYCEDEIKESFFYKSSQQRIAIMQNWTGLYSNSFNTKGKQYFIKIKPKN